MIVESALLFRKPVVFPLSRECTRD
jgi:hypothetical protein